MNQRPKKRVVLLGATGSIGESTLKVVRDHSDCLELVGIAAGSNYEKLSEIAQEFKVPHVALQNKEAAAALKKSDTLPQKTQIHAGKEGLCEIASLPEADCVLVAIVGTHGLMPTLAAINAGKDVALASKEVLVLGGSFVIEAAQKKQVKILPVDSEHCAIFQCLQGSNTPDSLKNIILTASGGQFRDYTTEQMKTVRPEDAIKHPNWSMGPKITVDSATMANKGLEMMEALWLFNLKADQIEVVIHPPSLVHSMVTFVDGSILAQLSPPSMTFAIQYSLLYPERKPHQGSTLNFSEPLALEFNPPNWERYPCLKLAKEALQAGGIAPGVFNASNEEAVAAFLDNKISFLDIPRVVDKTLSTNTNFNPKTLESALDADLEIRQTARDFIKTL